MSPPVPLAADAAAAEQEVVAADGVPLDVLHLGRVFARNASRPRLVAVDAGSDALNGSSRLSSPKMAAAVAAAVAVGALASSSSLRTSASQSFRARVRPGAWLCAACACERVTDHQRSVSDPVSTCMTQLGPVG